MAALRLGRIKFRDGDAARSKCADVSGVSHVDRNRLDHPWARRHLLNSRAYLDRSVVWQRDRRHVSQADRSWFAKTALKPFAIRSRRELSQIPSAAFSVTNRQILVFGASLWPN